jgi:lipoate-protein ligase A
VHQHGTILLKVDPSLMFAVLKVPNEKIRDKLIKSVEERVTSLHGLLKREVSFDELKEALVKGFEVSFKITLVQGALTEFEEQKAAELKTEKYAKRGWNFKR